MRELSYSFLLQFFPSTTQTNLSVKDCVLSSLGAQKVYCLEIGKKLRPEDNTKTLHIFFTYNNYLNITALFSQQKRVPIPSLS